jgi:hypothetical protein
LSQSKLFGLIALFYLSLGWCSPLYASKAAPDGGMGITVREKPAKVFSNRSIPQPDPIALTASDKPTYVDPKGRLMVYIDRKHGSLKGLRFPDLLGKGLAAGVDRYIVHDGISSSELDDEVTGFEMHAEAEPARIVIDCLNRRSKLVIRKTYTLDPAHHEVIKTLEIDSPENQFVTVVTHTTLTEGIRKGGYYYQYLAHTSSRYVSYPTASIGNAYCPNKHNYQSSVWTVTRPDTDVTYGEVQLSVNDVPSYLCVAADSAVTTANSAVETLLTNRGWQLVRGSWVQVGPGRGAQKLSWLHSAVKGTHLMWHANYHKRYFFPAFAPERPLSQGMDLVFDASFLWPHAVADLIDGRLVLKESDRDLWTSFLDKRTVRWDGKPLILKDNNGTPLWYSRIGEFDALHEMFKRLDLDRRGWVTCGLAETMYTMGDFLSDHMWFHPGLGTGTEAMIKVSMNEYFRFVRDLQRRYPEFSFFNYERATYYSHGETIQKHLELALYKSKGSGYSGEHTYSPRYETFFELMTGKYLDLQKEGVSLYVDWAIPTSRVRKREDGTMAFEGYDTGQKAVKKMAAAMREAGGYFFVNQPSGPWADLGFIEGGRWDTETRDDWRYVAERLQLYKLHEFRPNTIIALNMMCDEFIHQALMYNFMPGVVNRMGVPTKQSWAPMELIRLRWYLREARMAPVPLRPVAWENPDSPLETVTMTLPGTVYLAAYNHILQDHTADLSVDLGPVLDRKPYAMWKVDITKGPWVGVVSEQGIEPHERNEDGSLNIGYKFEKAETEFISYDNAVWDDLRLKLPGVKIPKRQSVYFFMATVPAVVRSVEGKDVLWPVSSQPHFKVEEHPDGTLLIRSGYDEVVLAVSPDWLSDDAGLETRDEELGWPTVSVLPGTWRLKPDGRLLYENRPAGPPAPTVHPVASLQPVVTKKPMAGVEDLAAANVLTLQNGKDGYQGQTKEQMNTGQWGAEGHAGPGADGIFLYDNKEEPRYSRELIRFDLEGRLPAGTRVTRAVMVIHSTKPGGSNTAEGYKVLKPWTDGKTWWNNWGHGGSDPGYIDETAVCSTKVGDVGNTHFILDVSVVQGWLEKPGTNHGLLLKSLHGDRNFHWWAHGDKDKHPPKLVIEYDTK